MSTTARSTPRGGKNNKAETLPTPKTQKLDVGKSECPKAGLEKFQTPTAEQMRMAEIMDTKKDDLALKDKIKQVMDATQKTEDEVCTALHDCDNDANRAVNYLLEGSVKNEWSTSVMKKKKNRTTSSNKGEGATNNHVGGGGSGECEDWDEPKVEVNTATSSTRGRDRERTRQRGSGPPRLRGRGSMESRGWRGRENKENERNLEDNGFSSERGRRGDRGGRMANGPGRGGRGGRGGGRLGSRTFQSRDKMGPSFPRNIDTWNNPSAEQGSGDKMENWDNGGEDWDTEDSKPKPNDNWADKFPSPEDWDNEEYTGSLADSKVFTPSSGPEPSGPEPDNSGPDDNNLVEQTQPLSLDIQPPSRPVQMPPSPVPVNTLNAAQTQYLTQLTQSSESYKSSVGLSTTPSYNQQAQPSQPTQYPVQYPPATVPYSSSYANSYSSSLQDLPAPVTQNMPPRAKPQKPRVPPPSKIPSSAVEMPPGDVSLLDVQFGGLEFGSDSATMDISTPLETTNTTTTVPSSAATPIPPAPTPTSVSASVASLMDSYANQQQQQANLANALAQTQKQLTPSESILQSEVVVTQPSSNSYTSQSTTRSTTANNVLSELTNSTVKSSSVDSNSSLSYNSTDSNLYQTQSYQKSSTAVSYPNPPNVSTYNPSSYSTSQVTSSSTSYNSQTTGYTNSTGVYGSSTGNSVAMTQSTPSVNSYPSNQTYSTNQASYAYTSYPATANTNNYHSTGQTYPPQSYQSTATTYPYPQQNHKINTALGSTQGKDSQYETGQVTNNSIPVASTVSSTLSLGLSATSQTVATTKVNALSTANKSGIVAGIPPQVPPMINTPYIMGNAGFPYLQQPTMFSYDDAMMLQQRIAAPPMATGYFDMSFQQQPTSLGTGRDASLGNVAYSMSDGRFARADNNASPVPSTLSQQSVTQGHQQAMLNPTGLPPGYTYIYGSFPNFQYGTPTLYPMAPTAATGSSTTGQYKGPTYGSTAGYSSGYETSADGYKVGSATGYAGTPTQTKTSGTPTTSTDLTHNMYTKGHTTLNKVNSYDKAGFHSGTPPPFNLTGSQSAGLAPSGTYPPHLTFISTLPPHQQHHSAATLMHQPLHQDGTSNSGPRSQATSQPNKAGAKQQNFTSPSFWANTS